MPNRLRIVPNAYQRVSECAADLVPCGQRDMERRARFHTAYHRDLDTHKLRYECTFSIVGMGVTKNGGGTVVELLVGHGNSRSAAVRDFVRQAWKAKVGKKLTITTPPQP